MAGTPVLAGWLAHIAFWALLAWGWATEEIGPRGLATFVLLWLGALIGLPYVFTSGGLLFAPIVAILDIVLVFLIVKGDIPLT